MSSINWQQIEILWPVCEIGAEEIPPSKDSRHSSDILSSLFVIGVPGVPTHGSFKSLKSTNAGLSQMSISQV